MFQTQDLYTRLLRHALISFFRKLRVQRSKETCIAAFGLALFLLVTESRERGPATNAQDLPCTRNLAKQTQNTFFFSSGHLTREDVSHGVITSRNLPKTVSRQLTEALAQLSVLGVE